MITYLKRSLCLGLVNKVASKGKVQCWSCVNLWHKKHHTQMHKNLAEAYKLEYEKNFKHQNIKNLIAWCFQAPFILFDSWQRGRNPLPIYCLNPFFKFFPKTWIFAGILTWYNRNTNIPMHKDKQQTQEPVDWHTHLNIYIHLFIHNSYLYYTWNE